MRQAHNHRPTAVLGMEDLEQIARIALWRCSLRWRLDGGASFHTFASRTVPLELARAFHDTSGVARWAYERGKRLYVEALDTLEADHLDAIGAVEGHYSLVEWRVMIARHLRTTDRMVVERTFCDGAPFRDVACDAGISAVSLYVCRRRELETLKETIEGGAP